MENNLQIGVVLKKRENIYTPEKTIYGYFKEEEKSLLMKITLNMILFLRKKIMQLHLFLMLKFC